MTQVPPSTGVFSDDDWVWLRANSQVRSVAPNAYLIKRGQKADVFVILEGEFLVSSISAPVPPHLRQGTGPIPAELAHLWRGAAQADLRALVHSRVLVIPHFALERRIEQDAGFESRFRGLMEEIAAGRCSRFNDGNGGPPGGREEAAGGILPAIIEGMLPPPAPKRGRRRKRDEPSGEEGPDERTPEAK